jgi:hypothetical protein
MSDKSELLYFSDKFELFDGKIRLETCRSDGCCRVEVVYGNQWGTVCDDDWQQLDTQVVCRQMGCGGGSYVYEFGGGSGPIWMDNVNCDGSEAFLASCGFDGWGNNNCGHNEDVGVCCTDCTSSGYSGYLSYSDGLDSPNTLPVPDEWTVVCATSRAGSPVLVNGIERSRSC